MKYSNKIVYYFSIGGLLFGALAAMAAMTWKVITLLNVIPGKFGNNTISFQSVGSTKQASAPVQEIMGAENLRLQIFLKMVPSLLTDLFLAWCFWQLFSLVRDVQHDRSFEGGNSRRLRNIGLGILFLQAFLLLYDIVMKTAISSPNILSWLVVGCVLLIVARAFAKGNELQDDYLKHW